MRMILRIAVRVLLVMIIFIGMVLAFFALIRNAGESDNAWVPQTAHILTYDAHR